MSVEATSFPDAEIALSKVIKAAKPGVYASHVTPSPIPLPAVIFGFSGGGFRSWGEAAVNVGVNVYAATEKACRDLAIEVGDILATAGNDEIEWVAVPAGGATSVPDQSPPFQRYFAVTAHLRGQTDL